MDFNQQIQLNYDGLSTSDKEMVQYIKKNREEVISLSIVDLGERLLSSKSTVLRLVQKLGFRGYSDFKYSLEQSLHDTFIAPSDLTGELKQEILKTFQYAEQTNFQPLIDKLKTASTVLIYATGFSQNNYSKEFSNDLVLSGRPNYLVSGESNFRLVAQNLTPKDLVIVTSLGGNTNHIRQIVTTLNYNEVPICSVTKFKKSFLSEHATFQLYYETTELPPKEVVPMESMVGLNIILSILGRKYKEYILFDE